jgi:hypothetical protein
VTFLAPPRTALAVNFSGGNCPLNNLRTRAANVSATSSGLVRDSLRQFGTFASLLFGFSRSGQKHSSKITQQLPPVNGRGGVIRTRDPLLPKQMRYQAAPRPDCSRPNPPNSAGCPLHVLQAIINVQALFKLFLAVWDSTENCVMDMLTGLDAQLRGATTIDLQDSTNRLRRGYGNF